MPGVPAVPPPARLGARLCEPIEATYVSTTTAGDWLDRVVAHDLGVRSAAVVTVHEAGVVIARTGARDVFVPAASVLGVERTPGIAGKYVGGDGLVVIRWTTTTSGAGTDEDRPENALDTGLRVRRAADRPVLTAAVAGLLAGPAATAHASTEENP